MGDISDGVYKVHLFGRAYIPLVDINASHAQRRSWYLRYLGSHRINMGRNDSNTMQILAAVNHLDRDDRLRQPATTPIYPSKRGTASFA